MSAPYDAAIQAVRDRLTPSSGPMAQSPMSDFENDPGTRTDAVQNLNNWLVDDPDTTYGDLADSVGAEDTPEFRKAVDDELSWDEAGHQAWLDDMGHVNDDEDAQ